MADLLSLDQIKAQLNVTGVDDDALLGIYLAGAVKYGSKETGGRVLADMPADDQDLFKIAVLQIIAHWYANRESVAVGQSLKTEEIPQSADKIFSMLTELSIG